MTAPFNIQLSITNRNTQGGDPRFEKIKEDSQLGYQRQRQPRTLEPNCIAVANCHRRKQEKVAAPASRDETLKSTNRYLSACRDSLAAEYHHLKTELLRHTHFSCLIIQKYITNEARRYVNRMAKVCASIHRGIIAFTAMD